MVYDDLAFRGRHILEERERLDKQRLIAASFTAWQMLSAQIKDPPPWRKYIKGLGLLDELPVSKEELKREADQAMKNAEKIIAMAKRGNDVSG